MSDGLRVLAVDDERNALEDLAWMLDASELVADVDTATSGNEAMQKVGTTAYDAIFLDVRMPGLDGVGLARVLRRFARPPAVVFVTAYESAAVEAFALRAADYLMKPVGRARLEEALRRVAEPAAQPAPEAGAAAAPEDEADVVPVDNVRGGGTRLVPRSSILYLQAHGDYVRLVTDDGRFLLRARLADIERRWEPFGFVRVHRGYVANLKRAVEVRPLFNGTAVLVFGDGSTVPIARRQVAELRRWLHR
ncbi:MAG TPA: LytTR family DNA-binding domain-containing protein [Solirubrobacteraceae bacterium]